MRRAGRARRAAERRGRSSATASSLPFESVVVRRRRDAADAPPHAAARARSSPSSCVSTRPGGTILVVDQLAPVDPLAALELNALRAARDPSTTRVLRRADLRGLFDSNSLVLRARARSTASRATSTRISTSPAARAPSASAAHGLAPAGYEAVARLVRPALDALGEATAPGASACTHAAGRYQRGTMISRLVVSTASSSRSTTSGGSTTSREQQPAEAAALREARRSRRSRGSRCAPRCRAARARRASERENASCACFDAEYGPTATVPATETTLTTCEPAAEPGQERERRPDRAEVVDADHLLDPLGLARRGSRRARATPALLTSRSICGCRSSTRAAAASTDCAVGDVALLVLVGLRRPAGEPDDERAARLQLRGRARRRCPDDAPVTTATCRRGAARPAAALRPAASTTVAVSGACPSSASPCSTAME